MTAKYATTGVFGALLKDPHFWAPTLAMGAGAAAAGVAGVVQKITDARAQAKTYKEMIDLHPNLAQRPDDLVKRIFTSLNNVNPTMGRDPMVAGAWVDTIIESGGIDQTQAGRALLEGVKDLAQIRSHMSQARRSEQGAGGVGHMVERGVMHGFGRAKELESELGETETLRKQIKSIQEQHAQERQIGYAEKVHKNLMSTAGSLGIPPQDLLSAVSSGAASEGARLRAAVAAHKP